MQDFRTGDGCSCETKSQRWVIKVYCCGKVTSSMSFNRSCILIVRFLTEENCPSLDDIAGVHKSLTSLKTLSTFNHSGEKTAQINCRMDEQLQHMFMNWIYCQMCWFMQLIDRFHHFKQSSDVKCKLIHTDNRC